MHRQLERVKQQVRSDMAKREAPIGLLTGTQRDTWTELHGHLSSLSPQNKESFALIETALFAVALDDRVFTNVDSFASEFFFIKAINSSIVLEKEFTYLQLWQNKENTFHAFDGHNRWFDKALTIVVTKDGMLGLNGEVQPILLLIL